MQIPDNHWLYCLKADIQKIEPSAQLILYGSRARGDARPDSDWDFLLLTDKPKVTFKFEDEIRIPITLMEIEIGEPFNLQILNRQKWENRVYISPFFENVEKDGILI